jgi:hypothetical protein
VDAVKLIDGRENEMRKVIVNEWMSLDGVVQAPGAADEDTTGGFEHGKRIFRDDGALRPLRLVDSEVTTTGAILATYAPARAPRG